MEGGINNSTSTATLMWQCAMTINRVQDILRRANGNSSQYYTFTYIDATRASSSATPTRLDRHPSMSLGWPDQIEDDPEEEEEGRRSEHDRTLLHDDDADDLGSPTLLDYSLTTTATGGPDDLHQGYPAYPVFFY